jgi:UDP-N-acetylglucosamine--N-acetylmuramyl-(pentapeptide) pyrophosphoryl-undecaprenol N-acetylglucosamine transferase
MTIQRLVFTGGGTAGHVTPNLALIKPLKRQGVLCTYIGSTSGLEEALVAPADIPFKGVRSGKLRRYFSLKTLFEPFQILIGVVQAFFYLSKLKPDVVFSKGGFVAVPVVVAAFLKRIPVVAHESDLTPGLANKLSYPFSKTICVTFPGGDKYFKNKEKVRVTGTPIRDELLKGNKEKARAFCGFSEAKPTLLIMGGGQGSVFINEAIRESLSELTQQFCIIHLCGRGKVDPSVSIPNYAQFEYVSKELPDCFALADLVIARSGANSVYEILALKKPHIFIPLSLKASRGDQIHNANFFKETGISTVLDEDTLSKEALLQSIDEVFANKEALIKKMGELNIRSGTDKIIAQIREARC